MILGVCQASLGQSERYCNGQPIRSYDTRYYPNGQIINRYNTYYYPNGQVVNQYSTCYYPNGQVINRYNTYYYPNGQVVNKYNTRYYPNGQVMNRYNTYYYPNGSQAPHPPKYVRHSDGSTLYSFMVANGNPIVSNFILSVQLTDCVCTITVDTEASEPIIDIEATCD
jgi:hypothetical protein